MYYQTERQPHGGDVYGAGPPVTLDFSVNVNPLGTPQSAVAAARAALDHAGRYPDPHCRELVRAIADAEGVPERYILCGNGASELIYTCCMAAGARRAAEPAPTFSEYSVALARAGCAVRRYPLRPEEDYCLDDSFLRFLKAELPDAVFLCNPNNPTGRLIPPALLENIYDFCKVENIRLFLDECFLDLSDGGPDLKRCLAEFPGLFLLKAFTKTYGMAGLRLGYCLSADGALLAEMAAAAPPWNVSGPAQAAGVAALREREFLRESKELIQSERAYLKTALAGLGLRVCPSEANFLLFRGPEGLTGRLRARGIAIRDCANFPGLSPGWYRIAVRTRDENARLLAAMRSVI